jgi:hypothetical protein
MRADVTSARVVAQRLSLDAMRLTPSAIVVGLVRRFCDRWRRPLGAADDPRWSNSLFKDWAGAARKLLTQAIDPVTECA